MGHIDKIADSIKDTSGTRMPYKAKAQAAFNALIDAVPDLVWTETAHGSHEAIGIRGGYSIIDRGLNDFCLYGPGKFEIIGGADFDDLVKAANKHHRAQVRAIWEGTK